MHDLISIPEDGNFICVLDISKGTDVSTVIDLCKISNRSLRIEE